MKLFDLFGKKNSETASLLSEQNDPDEVVFGIFDHILEKSAYGDRPNRLTPEERVILVVRLVEDEVNNGGFSQFIFNSSGNFAGETVASMTAIGAHSTAAICQKAMDAIRTAYAREKYIAAICAGPTILAELGITDGRQAVCYPGCEEEMGSAHILANAPCVRDGRVITAASAGCATAFALELIAALKGQDEARRIASQIVIR